MVVELFIKSNYMGTINYGQRRAADNKSIYKSWADGRPLAGIGCHSKTHKFQPKYEDARKWTSNAPPSVYSFFDLSKTQTIPFGKLYQ